MDNEKQIQVDLFSKIGSIEFKEDNPFVFYVCIINRTDRELFNLGTGNTKAEALDRALQVMAYTLNYPHNVSFWLKLCDPLPEVEEKDLKDRIWSISIDELEGDK